jgi:hypothetical protein
MKSISYLIWIIILVISAILSIFSGKLLPDKIFAPFSLKPDSTWHKESDDQAYMIKTSFNSKSELIVHHNINKSGNSIEYWHNNTVHQIYIFKKNEYLISKYLYFSSINQDSI